MGRCPSLTICLYCSYSSFFTLDRKRKRATERKKKWGGEESAELEPWNMGRAKSGTSSGNGVAFATLPWASECLGATLAPCTIMHGHDVHVGSSQGNATFMGPEQVIDCWILSGL